MDCYKEKMFEKVKPFVGVVFIQTVYAGMDVLSKAALNKGMSVYVFVFYCKAVACIVTVPFAMFVEKNVRPKMTIPIFVKIVALSLLEPVIADNLYFAGMKYTTATFVVALTNIFPAMTFIMACIFKLEKIKFKSKHGQAKVVGTLVSVAGAMVMTLIKGQPLNLFGTHRYSSNSHDEHVNGGLDVHQALKGSVMITIGCICTAAFVILQAITLEAYPAELSLTALVCLLATIEDAIVALVMERGNPSAWSLNWDSNLLLVAYSGIVCTGMVYYIQGVAMKYRGPVFVTAFNPLCMVFVAIMGSIFLAEQINLGRMIGAIVIIIGLYLVVWGKSKDYKPPCPVTKENAVLAKQTADESNPKEEHSDHEVITICNSDVGNIEVKKCEVVYIGYK